MNNFQIVHQDLNNSYLSLAVCANTHQGVIVSEKQFFPEVNGILVTTRKRDRSLKVLLLYHPKDTHPPQFCNNLENVLNTCKIELILGDFNINFQNEMESQYIRQMMQRTHYLQTVKSATFISSGSFLDHVYVSQILSENLRNKVKCEIRIVYYSDHDSVQICVAN